MVQQIMKLEDFLALIGSNKHVIVDFYAEWCAPCKRLYPYFTELSVKHKDTVFVSVDVEASPDITTYMSVSALPSFCKFTDGKNTDTMIGSREEKLAEFCEL